MIIKVLDNVSCHPTFDLKMNADHIDFFSRSCDFALFLEDYRMDEH